MGMFNEYGTKPIVQLKVGSQLQLDHMKDGDKADIADGLYVGYGGFVVIHNGEVVTTFRQVIGSHGEVMEAKDVWPRP